MGEKNVSDSLATPKLYPPKCPKCGEPATYRTVDGTLWDSWAHYWRIEPSADPSLQVSPEPRADGEHIVGQLKMIQGMCADEMHHMTIWHAIKDAIRELRTFAESRVTAPVGQLSCESAETIAVTLVEEVLKLQREGYTHYCKSNMAQMIKTGVDAALASPPQIAQRWTDQNLYDAYLCGCEDDCLPEPMSVTMFLAQFTGGK